MTDYNPFSLTGKTILVSGASSGIGHTTAMECAKMGATLIITGRNEERLTETLSILPGENHRRVIADLTQQEDLEKLIAEIDILDGMVLCAGTGVTCPFQFATRDKLEKVFDINFYAPIELLRLIVKKKKLNKGSSVVFVSSVGGIYSINPGNSVYGASKSAFNTMMRFCAKELAAKKIRVNSVNPGMVETPLIHGGVFSEEDRANDIAKYPLNRYGQPNEVAYGIIYLLSEASAWVTGTSLVIDGGLTIKKTI